MFLALIIRLAGKAAAGIRSHLALHRTSRELSGLSDHALRDIGISRMDIGMIARDVVRQKAQIPSQPANASAIAAADFIVREARSLTAGVPAANDVVPQQLAS